MRGERGGAAIVIAATAALVLVAALGVVSLGMAYAGRAKAASAADAAALAAAVATYPPAGRRPPILIASSVARQNDAVVTRCECAIDASLEVRTVSVRVEVGVHALLFGQLPIRAVSRAEFDPRGWLGR